MLYFIKQDCTSYTAIAPPSAESSELFYGEGHIIEIDDRHLNAVGEKEIMDDLLYVFKNWPLIDYHLLDQHHVKLID